MFARAVSSRVNHWAGRKDAVRMKHVNQTRRYTDEAIAFIQRSKDKPFFVFIPHTMPHTRLGVSEKFRGTSARQPTWRRPIRKSSPAFWR